MMGNNIILCAIIATAIVIFLSSCTVKCDQQLDHSSILPDHAYGKCLRGCSYSYLNCPDDFYSRSGPKCIDQYKNCASSCTCYNMMKSPCSIKCKNTLGYCVNTNNGDYKGVCTNAYASCEKNCYSSH